VKIIPTYFMLHAESEKILTKTLLQAKNSLIIYFILNNKTAP